MAYRYSDAWIEDLRSRADLVDVVSEYVELKQKGRRFWGRCPFHSEKTPSFSVDSQAQMYYCFGCHKGGTVINFVMDMERLEFVEALEYLAEKVHMPLPQRVEDAGASGSRQLRERILEANKEAARFYHATLWTAEGAIALSYLHRRGLDDAGIRRFGLGATPQSRDGLTRHLMDMGYTFDELKQANLSKEQNGRKDVFFDRAMFPIINAQGHVLGFGGRIMGDGNGPKYLNTADTPVFNKRQGLYALNMVRKERGLSRLILVEGYMDVVSLRNQGVQGVVATLGTALTEEQAKLFKRYAPEVWVCYDGDGAGQKAILRALDIFESQNFPAKVIDIPGGQDPDEYVREHGAAGFEALKPMPPADYRMLRAADKYDLSQEDGRMQYAIECCRILRSVPNPVELDNYLSKLSVQTGIDPGVLMQQVRMSGPTQPTSQQSESAPARPRRHAAKNDTPEHVRAEQMLIGLMASGQVDRDVLNDTAFITPLYASIAKALCQGQSPAVIIEALDGADREQAAQAMMADTQLESDQVVEAVQQCLQKLEKYRKNEQIPDLMNQIKAETDPARRAELMTLLSQLSRHA